MSARWQDGHGLDIWSEIMTEPASFLNHTAIIQDSEESSVETVLLSKGILAMKPQLKKLSDQVIVITGASSGIGLETARQAVAAGASVVLSSRNLAALNEICTELNTKGPGHAFAVECDVKNGDQVKDLANQAILQFGRIDTWINNAGVTIYGKLTEVPLDEKRELFETNFWGVVNGCRSAVKELSKDGGAIINIGSVLSERVIPMQGMYCASKHAVKAYTDGLRMELEADGCPISVTLVKPAAIDTPYIDHGVNHMAHHPTHTGPVYSPSIVAKAILHSAVHPRRDIYAGGSGKVFWFMEQFLPRFTDLVMEKTMMEKGQIDPRLDAADKVPSLMNPPRREGFVRGTFPGRVMTTSAYTTYEMHPVAAAAVATGLGLAAAAGISYVLNARKSTSSMKAGRRAVAGSQRRAGSSVKSSAASDLDLSTRVTH